MIEGNVLKFGYGDICVGGRQFRQSVTFRQFKPPANCGDKIIEKNIEYTGEELELHLCDLNEYARFVAILKCVKSGKCNIFGFKNLIFDFTNYNEKSVDTCIRKADEAIESYLRCMAC